MTPERKAALNAHLNDVNEACERLPAEPMLNREQFRETLCHAQEALAAAEDIVLGSSLTLDLAMFLMARIQLAATNLNTAVAAYRASWSST